MTASRSSLALCLSVLFALGCSEHSERDGTASEESPSSARAASGPVVAPRAEAVFAARAGWEEVPSTSKMRRAQYRLPRQGADAKDAELVVYYFGGSGGGVEANVERWLGQFRDAGGGAIAAPDLRESLAVGDTRVTRIEVSGTYVAETRPGSNERFNEPGYRLLAAILERADGPFFLKLVGPAATVAHWRVSFDEFVAEAAR